jgi:hypothetical protein
MKARYERRAWRIQKQINQLKEERAESERAIKHASASLGPKPPRLRDRNRFFHSLLNGELDVFEQTAPQWRHYRQSSRKANRINARLAAQDRKIERVIRRGMANSEVQGKLDREKAARRSCNELLKSIGEARRRINRTNKRNPQNDASRSAVDEEAEEVSNLISAVRRRVSDVTQKTLPHRSFDASDVVRLELEFPASNGRHNVRRKRYKEANVLLDSLETRAKSILDDIGRREKILEDQLRLRIAKERARFDETTPPPS